MGIKGLWTVLTPYSEKKSLHELRGETLAVDLAGWVCDSQNVTDYYIQPKLYLRNLFFRTVYLVLADIKPIFVLEGDAPELKRDVMAARNAIQFRGAAPRADNCSNKRPDVGRKRFKNVLKECESMLKCLGVSCVKGDGEAEATCAQLNAQGLVDAVISQDSDCFAYGARRVYRNFSVSNSAGGGALQGSVDCYDATKLIESTGFGRNKMVALALLCGCDYGVGACGSSITTVVTFLHTVDDADVIPRLVSWVSDPKYFEEKSRWLSVPGRCDRCGHSGRTHGKNGCPVCVTHKGCNDTGHKSKMADVKRELALRTRAISCGSLFPEPRVMKEFLNATPTQVSLQQLKPVTPSLIQFIKLMTKKLDWSERYCVEKFLPLLTKYHLQEKVLNVTLKPMKIIKKRVPRGVPSFEVVWGDVDGQYEGLIPDDQFEADEDPLTPWTTTERQDLMRNYYPDLVDAYEESIKKPPKEKKGRRKKNDNVEQTNELPKTKRKYTRKPKASPNRSRNNTLVHNTSKLNVSVKVNKLKRKHRVSKTKSQKTIDSFVQNKKRRVSNKIINSLRNSFRNISLQQDNEFDELLKSDLKEDKENIFTEINLRALSVLDSSDDINESDLSEIVDNIVSKAPKSKTAKVNNDLVRLVFQKHSTPRKSGFRKSLLSEIRKNCSTPNGSPVRRNSSHPVNITNDSLRIKNTSYFFDNLTDLPDAFETSVNNLNCDSDKTINYSVYDEIL